MSSPIIFEKGTRDFSTLGLGLLSDAIQATTTEELNGQFIFEMDYPADGNNADLIKENRIIVVDAGHILKRQGFIIRQIVRKIDLTMSIYAEHVSYATLDVALGPLGTVTGSAKTALEIWKRMLVPAVDFTVDSDILTNNSTQIGAPEFETARQGLGGHAGSILDVWGGEYKFDNWHISLLKQRGKAANAIIAYGRNLTSFEQDTNIADTYTSVYPYYQEHANDNVDVNHFLPERIVNSEHVDKYPNPKVLLLDLSDKFKDAADYSEAKLRNYALAYIKSNNIGIPKVNMKISTVDLSKATGGFAEDIDLGDIVNVYFEKLGITTSAKIIKAVWNVLSDSYDKFEIGARRASLTESVTELATNANENATKALNQAVTALQSADGKSTIYYLNSGDPWPDNPKENDTAFVKDGENTIMYRYLFNNETGEFSWVKILDTLSADRIEQKVSETLESAQKYSDKLVDDNAEQVNRVLSDVQDKQVELKNEQLELDRKAQEYANKALSDAKVDTQETVAQTARDAQQALANAKTELTNSLSNEIRDRAKALSDLDKKATDAINKAKEDAQSALNALQIGGRNYLLNSNGSSLSGWSAPSLWSVTNDPIRGSVFMGQPTVTWTGGGMNSLSQATTNVPIGSVVTVSFYAKADVDNAHFHSEPLGTVVSFNPRLTTEWERYTYTYTMGANNQRVYFMPVDAGTTYYLDDIKLEIGNKATDYTQSPEDVVMDYTTKDNEIKRTLTKYQQDNDGRVSTAQSAVNQALGELSTKVSETTFDQKTGDLENKYTTIKQTADNISADITNIQNTDRGQDHRMANIEADANGLRSTVSSIQTTQGQQSGSISTLQQTADRIEAKVSTLGQVNQLFNTEFSPDFQGWFTGNSSTSGTYKTGLELSSDTSWALGYGKKNGSTVLKRTYGTGNSSFFSNPILVGPGVTITASIWSNSTAEFNGTVSAAIYLRYYDSQLNYIGQGAINSARNTNWTQTTLTATTPANTLYVVFNLLTNGNTGVTYYSQPMLTFTDKVGAYVAGNYNNNASVAKAQMTADEAKRTITSYQTSADGRISSAESNISQNASAITTKVSQTEFNSMSGELTRKVNEAQRTADNATSTLGSYKTSNDGRISNAESKIKQNAEAITSKVSQTEFNQKTGQIEGAISTFNQTASGISQSVSDVKGQVDGLQVGGRNYVLNSSGLNSSSTVRPTLSGTVSGANVLVTYPADGILMTNSTTNKTGEWYYQVANAWANFSNTPLKPGGTYTFSADVMGTVPQAVLRWGFNGPGGFEKFKAFDINNTTWTRVSITTTSNATNTGLYFRVQGGINNQYQTGWSGGETLKFRYIKIEDGNMPTAWTPAPEDAESKIATQKITIDGITEAVSKHTSDINSVTSRVTTAEGTITTTKNKVDDLESTQTQTAKQITSEVNDRKNGDTNTLTQANNFTTSSINSSAEGLRSQITQTSDAILARVEATNMVVNSEFDPLDGTWYRIGTGAPAGTKVFEAWVPSQAGSFQDWPAVNGSRIISYSTGNWYTSTLQVASAGKAYSASIVAGRSPAPTVSTALDFSIAFWDSNRALIGTMSSGNIIDGTSYKGIQKYVVENKVAPANTRFVSVVIAHSSGNASDFITRPSLNMGEKASPYTPTYGTNASSTVLSLLKNNWSIGIADNIGAITSGIVGNANSMSLISDMVIINAPQTQIKGTAWITSAMIANGQIGTAQIGDASITSAKISSLDVNKITGNISNWVLSQWTSATGNKVTIDGNGMYFSPGASRMTRHGFEAWRPDSNAGGGYAAMGMLGSYAWETNSNINGVGLFAKFNGVPHDDPGSPYRGEIWGGDTIAIGAVQPQSNHGYGYIEPYMIFPANNEVGNMYRPGNNSDTLILSRWLSIYTGLNMRGNSIVNSSGYSLKENFKPVSGKEALDIFDNTDIMSYDYKPDSEEMDERTEANRKDKVGFVINDNGQSPFKTDPRLVRYGNTRDDSVTVGYLMSAVKELHSRIKELEAQQGK